MFQSEMHRISHDFSSLSGTRQPRSRHPSRSGWDPRPTSKLHPPGSFVTKGGDMSWDFFWDEKILGMFIDFFLGLMVIKWELNGKFMGF